MVIIEEAKTKKTDQVFFTTKIFSKVLYKTNFCNKKGNQVLLGIDILKDDVKKELLSLAILRLEEVFTKLSAQPNYRSYLQKNGKSLFFDCIKKVCEDFLTKKLTVIDGVSSVETSIPLRRVKSEYSRVE